MITSAYVMILGKSTSVKIIEEAKGVGESRLLLMAGGDGITSRTSL